MAGRGGVRFLWDQPARTTNQFCEVFRVRRFLKPAALFVALGFSVALAGCNDLSELARDVMYAGTNVGYQRCIERNQNVGVSAKPGGIRMGHSCRHCPDVF